MFGKKVQGGSQARIDSLIGVGTTVEGKVRFSGGLRIDGEVRGSVESLAVGGVTTLMVSDQARIEGAVAVGHLVLNGTIVGPVSVSETLEMQPKARIVGDVSYSAIEMHQGAVIEGRLVHVDDAQREPISSAEA
ncbi:polymer-forming cytoskeletal protein [Malonomonas rubra]|uniref:bactofilin family protein n=1 Tax=Malonomonas rubra TaxID=57040 RepID=UPI0026EF45D3|nr:polymer-forming cytoskeletal protein [Malonomonas rubra]